MKKEEFVSKLSENGITLTPTMLQQFEQYYELIAKYNQVMDLTAISGEDEVYDRHFYNSLTIAFHSSFDNLSLCDVGSGAGFPSIPLKIVFPNMKLTIIDSLSKRMDFLKIVIHELNLKDVTIYPARVEDVALKLKEKFDIVTARAVAKLNVLMELCSQLVKVEGMFIAMKGQSGEEELQDAKNAMEICKLSLVKESKVDPSINFYFVKLDHIDRKYPRNYGQIKKNPL